MRVGVDRFHLLERVTPVPRPVTLCVNLILVRPSSRPLSVVDNSPIVTSDRYAVESLFAIETLVELLLASLWHVGDVQPAAVRPAGDGHPLAVVEQLHTGAPALSDFSVFGDALTP